MANKKWVQLHGPFLAKQNLMDNIREEYPDCNYIEKLGIQSIPAHFCNINGSEYEIGKTGILEFENVKIGDKDTGNIKHLLYFIQDEDINTVIDCFVK